MVTVNTPQNDDPFNLGRFLKAQQSDYANALAEIKSRQKRTHWMWYIFPQLEGLGFSSTSKYYGIKSIEEAQAYLNHPILGARLRECAEAVNAVTGRSIFQVFGSPDDMKLKSCATLFAAVPESDPVFERLMMTHFQGERDGKTLQLLKKLRENRG